MKKRRNTKYRKHWRKLIEIHGEMCFYCQIEPSLCIDHIIPVSYGGNDEIENLVPSCNRCNLTASDKVFNDVYHKRQYILANRKKKLTHAMCSACLLPYQYRIDSPSLVLCAECYDAEYGTNYAQGKGWASWIDDLEAAGYFVEAHRESRIMINDLPNGTNRNSTANKIIATKMYQLGYYESDELFI